MRTIVSLEFEHKKWSWGYTSQFLLNELTGFKIMSMEFKQWKRKRRNVDTKEACFLSQNVSQFRELNDYSRIVARLGGNRTFDDASFERKQDYLVKMAKCYAIIATNEKLRNIAQKVNSNVYLIPNGLDLDEWIFKKRPLKNKNVLIVGFVGNVRTSKKAEYKGYTITKNVCEKLGFSLKEALYMDKQIPHNQMQEKFYDKIDVLVLLTDGEGCSNTIMECLACGIPVITTKEAGFHGEAMMENENILFCKKDQQALDCQLTTLNQNRNFLKMISIEGRVFAEKHHNIKIIAKTFQKILKGCFKYNEKLSQKRKEDAIELEKKFILSRRFTSFQSKVTIVCVLKSGGAYTIDYVTKLKNMIDRNTTIPYEFVCLTDMDIDKNVCESIKLIRGQTGWWSKIELFRPNLIKSKQIIYFDLDTIILKNIDDILDFQHNFSALYPWNEKNRRNGLCASGMMAWKSDNTFSFIFDRFDPGKTKNYPRGDQEYISQTLRTKKKKPEFLQNLFPGIYSYKRNCRKQLPENARIICFHGKPRLHEIEIQWVKDNWG